MIAFCIIVVNINLVTSFTTPDYEILYSNGWVPITVDKVFKIPIDKQQSNNDNMLKLNVKPEPVEIEKEIQIKEDLLNCDDAIKTCINNNIDPYELENDFIPNTFYINEENTKRQSKKISDFRINNKLFDLENEESNKSLNKYEVIEVNNEDIQIPNDRDKQTGYIYEKSNKNDFINKLINVLLKYNIRINDKLPHYALSRRQKVQIPMQQDYRKPFLTYNSLNHLPVDPLLAVFLSNYGYYLQGRYGMQNNYKNLYGYLASNNIHNNKPFGFYKLFSDTDSSN